jgi:hypothetical protein
VAVVVNFQSVSASFVSIPSGSRDSEPATVLESATLAARAIPSTRSYVCPSMVATWISPSYERASSSVPVAVSMSATPSGAPFWASISSARYPPAASDPERATRSYSFPSPPFTVTSAMPSSAVSVAATFAISTNPPESAPTWS